jgi:hypothetical protein
VAICLGERFKPFLNGFRSLVRNEEFRYSFKLLVPYKVHFGKQIFERHTIASRRMSLVRAANCIFYREPRTASNGARDHQPNAVLRLCGR